MNPSAKDAEKRDHVVSDGKVIMQIKAIVDWQYTYSVRNNSIALIKRIARVAFASLHHNQQRLKNKNKGSF